MRNPKMIIATSAAVCTLAFGAGCSTSDSESSEPLFEEPTTTKIPVTTTTDESERTTTTEGLSEGDFMPRELAEQMIYDELGEEMGEAVIEMGETVCDNIDTLGVDTAMEIAVYAAISENLTDDEIEFVTNSIILGVTALCPENLDDIERWSNS